MRSNSNFEVVKEPRGFIKCLEIILAIFAFSCATGFRGSFKFRQNHKSNISTANHNVEGSFKYPFDSPITLEVATFNKTGPYVEVPVEIDQRSSTEFFVVIGVFCFLYSLGVLVYYIWFQEETKTAPTTTINSQVVDFVMGGVWAFFWFASACAQAAATNHIKDSTDVHKIVKSLKWCSINNTTCEVVKSANYATLTVAVLLGFLNVFVWAGNMWFLWKETPWHKGNRQPAATVQHPPPGAPQHQPTPPAAAI